MQLVLGGVTSHPLRQNTVKVKYYYLAVRNIALNTVDLETEHFDI